MSFHQTTSQASKRDGSTVSASPTWTIAGWSSGPSTTVSIGGQSDLTGYSIQTNGAKTRRHTIYGPVSGNQALEVTPTTNMAPIDNWHFCAWAIESSTQTSRYASFAAGRGSFYCYRPLGVHGFAMSAPYHTCIGGLYRNGGWVDVSNNCFIAEVTVWDRALPLHELQMLSNGTDPRSIGNGPTEYYPLRGDPFDRIGGYELVPSAGVVTRFRPDIHPEFSPWQAYEAMLPGSQPYISGFSPTLTWAAGKPGAQLIGAGFTR